MWGVVLKTGLHNLSQMICTLSVHSFGCSSGSAWAANVHAASARVSWPNRLGSHRQVPSVLEYSAWLVFVVQGWKLAAFWCATLVLRKGWSPYRRGPADVRPRGTSRAAVRKAPPSSAALPLVGWNVGARGRGRVSQALHSKRSCSPLRKHRYCPGCVVKSGSFPPLLVPQDLIVVSDICLFSAPFFLPAVIPHSDPV